MAMFMYHAQEKHRQYVPGSARSPAQRGGIHNSVTRIGDSSRPT
jgi:nitrate reductase alpha subunit